MRRTTERDFTSRDTSAIFVRKHSRTFRAISALRSPLMLLPPFLCYIFGFGTSRPMNRCRPNGKKSAFVRAILQSPDLPKFNLNVHPSSEIPESIEGQGIVRVTKSNIFRVLVTLCPWHLLPISHFASVPQCNSHTHIRTRVRFRCSRMLLKTASNPSSDGSQRRRVLRRHRIGQSHDSAPDVKYHDP